MWSSLEELLSNLGDRLIHRRVRVHDSARALSARKAFLSLYAAALLAIAAWLHETNFNITKSIAHLVYTVTACGLLPLMGMVVLTRVSPFLLLRCFVLVGTVAIICGDWYLTSTLALRNWTVAVILLDLILVFDLGLAMQKSVLGMVAVWIVLERAEHGYRFGLYEVAHFGGDIPDMNWNCASPPCAAGGLLAVGGMAIMMCVGLADFLLTRAFAVSMREQMGMVQASIQVAERVSKMLAGYSIEPAKQALEDDGGRLPPDLLEALRALLSNLEEYRPYLPDALLQGYESRDSSLRGAVQAPGIECSPSGSILRGSDPFVCICFTDIQSSTALWENHPQCMFDALRLHNTLLRVTAVHHSGYEVKTIGDAFMLAFADVCSACLFGIDAQRGLLEQPWPSDLLTSELCGPQKGKDGRLLWNGLRVRIGLHCGEVRVEQNPVTNRTDYFGPAVNTASRVESALVFGGLIGVTDPVLEAVSDMDALGKPTVVAMPPKSLKGVAGTTVIHVLLPQELASRYSPTMSALEPGLLLPAPFRVTTSDPLRLSRRSSTALSSIDAPLGELNSEKRRFMLGLKESKVTCCCIRSQLPEEVDDDLVGLLVGTIARAADSTTGELQTVLSSGAVVTWNTNSRPCESHANQCFHFLRSIVRFEQFSCGAATGMVVDGNIAASRKRFVTVFGGCTDLAAALAEEAQLRFDKVLAVNDVAMHARSLGSAFRAQMWRVQGEPRPVRVWQIDLREDSESEKWDGVLLSQPARCRPEERDEARLDQAFRSAAAAGAEALSFLEQLDGSELPPGPGSRSLLERAKRGAVLERSLPPVWGLTTCAPLN